MSHLKSQPGPMKDWVVIVAFYASIHYAMSYFHRNVPGYDDTRDSPEVRSGTLRLKGHQHRRALVRQHLPRMLKDYNYIETLAHRARYTDVDMSWVSENGLDSIENAVTTKFGSL